MEKSTHLTFALRLARAAEREVLQRFPPQKVETKADGSEVTAADRAAERAMRAVIEAEHPDHGVLGEEEAVVDTTGAYRWVLDPIDGTAWFALGIPKFGTLIGLLVDNRPHLGVIHFPITDETVFAEIGHGCWYRRHESDPIQVRVDDKVRDLSQAFVSAAGIYEGPGRHAPIDETVQMEVTQRAGKFRFVGDCIQHALVARGRLHAALDPVMKPWDSAAVIPCITEAGGVATTMSGESSAVTFGGSLLTSANPILHEQILTILNKKARA